MLSFCKKKQKHADISKINRILVLKGVFSEAKYIVYFCAKFQVSSAILTSFRKGGVIPPHLKTNLWKAHPD